ncbi:hypothetical protein FHR81_003374 [Actinoalloteichus hoggarensis]|uniref:hypothetical protein n=1 Tax=Actinoalloteichus hoggarensis TaxID=1470176 RepID=UPI0012FD2689|nr:hypothetical protein [Actinoalloteichus hoggarensis]MBB5922322.1 hypothetical protein [Actinoalloteichus hoggarensis]
MELLSTEADRLQGRLAAAVRNIQAAEQAARDHRRHALTRPISQARLAVKAGSAMGAVQVALEELNAEEAAAESGFVTGSPRPPSRNRLGGVLAATSADVLIRSCVDRRAAPARPWPLEFRGSARHIPPLSSGGRRARRRRSRAAVLVYVSRAAPGSAACRRS